MCKSRTSFDFHVMTTLLQIQYLLNIGNIFEEEGAALFNNISIMCIVYVLEIIVLIKHSLVSIRRKSWMNIFFRFQLQFLRLHEIIRNDNKTSNEKDRDVIKEVTGEGYKMIRQLQCKKSTQSL